MTTMACACFVVLLFAVTSHGVIATVSISTIEPAPQTSVDVYPVSPAMTTAITASDGVSVVHIPTQSIVPGVNTFHVTRPEGQRTFYVYVPRSYFTSNTTFFPLLFSYHGLGDGCTDYGPAVNFSWYADALPPPSSSIQPGQPTAFIYVYPCGTDGAIGVAWNAGTCCLIPALVDDIAFTAAMIEVLTTKPAVLRGDSKRLFVTGFSNGAFMTEVIGCHSAITPVTAIASVSGIVEMEPGNDDGLAACDSAFGKYHLPVLHIHGDADEIVPWTGDVLLGFPPVPQNMIRWAQRNGCNTTHTIQTFARGDYTNTVWNQCRNNITVELMKNKGGSHEWPMDQDFDTTNYIVNWLFKVTALIN